VIRRWIAAAVGLGVLWVFVRGAAATPAAVLGQFLLGLAVGTPIAYVFRRLYSEGIDLTRTVAAVPSVVGFVLVFLREVVIANFDVAYRVLAPGDRLQPEVILVPLRVETDLGITTIANSITITPGTLTLDHDPEGNALYVHVIDGRDPHAIVDPIRTWEDYALGIFEEPRSPGDPAPAIAVYPPGEHEPPEPHTATGATRRRTADDEGGGDGAE
jgi:multicomponent Na+:H+ antiporter subunit E